MLGGCISYSILISFSQKCTQSAEGWVCKKSPKEKRTWLENTQLLKSEYFFPPLLDFFQLFFSLLNIFRCFKPWEIQQHSQYEQSWVEFQIKTRFFKKWKLSKPAFVGRQLPPSWPCCQRMHCSCLNGTSDKISIQSWTIYQKFSWRRFSHNEPWRGHFENVLQHFSKGIGSRIRCLSQKATYTTVNKSLELRYTPIKLCWCLFDQYRLNQITSFYLKLLTYHLFFWGGAVLASYSQLLSM